MFRFLKKNKSKIQFFLLIISFIFAVYSVFFIFKQKGYNSVIGENFLTFFYTNNIFVRKPDLPLYKITIPQNSWDALEDEMPEENYVLENPFSWHSAVFEFEDKKYDIELKYRGVYDGHWRHEKKNMAIRFPANNLFKNREKLLLIIPEAMSMMPNSLNSYSAEVLGLPSPKTDFVQVYVNDQYWGVFEDSENVDEWFLENHNLPIGDVYDIEVDADSFLLNKWADEDYGVYWNRLAALPNVDYKDTTLLDKLIHVYNLESDKEFKKEIEKILDVNEYLHWAAHNYFPGTTRQSDHNIKLYYNPEIKKFWQIPWDLEGYSYNGHSDLSINAISNGLMDRILKFPDYNYQKNKIIWKYLNAELSAENQLQKLEEFYNQIKRGIYRDPYKRAGRLAIWYRNSEYNKAVEEMREWIVERDENLRFQLSQSNAMLKFENQGKWQADGYYLRFRVSTAWGVGVHIEEISLPLMSNSLINWELYSDNNHDGKLSYNDKLVLKGQSGLKELKIKIDELIFPDKSKYDPSQPTYKLEMFKDPITSSDYILKLDRDIPVSKDLSAVSYNAVTSEPIETAISFTDEIYYNPEYLGQTETETSFNFKEFLDNEAPQ